MNASLEARGRNHALWIGPVITFVGMVSYFTVFVRWPLLRDFPWVNLPLVLAGLTVSVVAFRRRRRASRLSRVLAWSGLGFSTLVSALFVFYIFVFSWMLPAPTTVTEQLEQAPEFELSDQHGRAVRLTDMRGKNVILVFFRGFW